MPQGVGRVARPVPETSGGPSVFEPTGEKLKRLVAGLLNQEAQIDPSDLMNPMGAPASVAVSAFMKPARELTGLQKLLSKIGLHRPEMVPDIPARGEATRGAANKLKHISTILGGIGDEPEMVHRLASGRYPRVTAHISDVALVPDRAIVGGRAPFTVLAQRQGKKSNPKLSQLAFNMETPRSDINNTIMHELTHVAQGIGDPTLPRLYGKASRRLGYENNPFEWSANATAEKHFPTGTRSDQYVPAKLATQIMLRKLSEKGASLQDFLEIFMKVR